MAALTSDRNAPERLGNRRSGLVAAGVRIFAGALVMRTATGHLAPGATATGAVGVGRSDIAANNTGGVAGAIHLDWHPGTFSFNNAAAADLVTLADVGKLCFIVDDNTVARTNGSATRLPAGIVDDVEGDMVWVRLDEALTRALA
ncbi:hypothetical protein E2974_18115 [Paracoccus yeei]|uniref:hypothetical protein n=1 Tax=Paracoccus yeei TaxID=147645 RepID=UPI003BF85FCE